MNNRISDGHVDGTRVRAGGNIYTCLSSAFKTYKKHTCDRLIFMNRTMIREGGLSDGSMEGDVDGRRNAKADLARFQRSG